MPSWHVHRALALYVSAGLSEKAVKGLLDGVVEPDVVADRKVVRRRRRCRIVNVHHHAGAPWDLMEYYFNFACSYRARGDLYMAGVALGRALHYIHDGTVKATGDVHDEIEREMGKLIEKLPGLCKDEVAKRSSKAAEAPCSTYLQSRRPIERFMTEPQPSRKEALKTLWLGRTKRWWPTTVPTAILVFFFVASPLAAPFLIALFFIVLLRACVSYAGRRASRYVLGRSLKKDGL